MNQTGRTLKCQFAWYLEEPEEIGGLHAYLRWLPRLLDRDGRKLDVIIVVTSGIHIDPAFRVNVRGHISHDCHCLLGTVRNLLALGLGKRLAHTAVRTLLLPLSRSVLVPRLRWLYTPMAKGRSHWESCVCHLVPHPYEQMQAKADFEGFVANRFANVGEWYHRTASRERIKWVSRAALQARQINQV